MSRLFASASSQYLNGAASPVFDGTVTIAAWYRPTATASAAVVASIGRDTASDRFQLVVMSSDVQATRVQTGGSATTASSSGTNSNGVRIHVAATFDVSGGNITAWRNGVAGTPLTNPGGALTLNRMLVGTRLNGGSPGAFANGDIAEVAVYNTLLSAGEIAALANGFTPDQIRPGSLAFYADLVRDIRDLRGGIVLTEFGGSTTVTDHPRIFL